MHRRRRCHSGCDFSHAAANAGKATVAEVVGRNTHHCGSTTTVLDGAGCANCATSAIDAGDRSSANWANTADAALPEAGVDVRSKSAQTTAAVLKRLVVT